MYFDATPLNMTTMLVITVAVIALYFLIRGRYDSNLPLLFYACTMILVSFSDRALNIYLLAAGVSLAMILRFEFMGRGFTKFIGILNALAIGLIVLVFLDQIFSDGTLLS